MICNALIEQSIRELLPIQSSCDMTECLIVQDATYLQISFKQTMNERTIANTNKKITPSFIETKPRN